MKLISALIILLAVPSCETNDNGRTQAGWWLRTHSWLPPFELQP